MARTAGSTEQPTIEQLAKQAREATHALARRPDVEAFNALLALSQLVGESLGESARLLAANTSWSRVAEASGTTKQAAWSRWNS